MVIYINPFHYWWSGWKRTTSVDTPAVMSVELLLHITRLTAQFPKWEMRPAGLRCSFEFADTLFHRASPSSHYTPPPLHCLPPRPPSSLSSVSVPHPLWLQLCQFSSTSDSTINSLTIILDHTIISIHHFCCTVCTGYKTGHMSLSISSVISPLLIFLFHVGITQSS